MIPHNATTLNLATIIEQHVFKGPDREAIVWKGVRLSYRELNAEANRAANVLTALGIGAGDHVALICPNVPHFAIAYFGILKTGAIVVPLNVQFKPREIAYHLRDSDAKALLCFEDVPGLPMAEMARAAIDVVPSCEHFLVMTANPAAPSPTEGSRSLGELMQHQADLFETYPTKPDETAVILYTSGTTGQPKGAELTHFNMVLNAMTVFGMLLPAMDAAVDARNVTLITLPLFHSTAQTAQMNASLFAGHTLVLLPKFDPAAVLETMRHEQVSYWVGVPTMYWTLLQYLHEHAVDVREIAKSLRIAASGGAPMPVAIMTEFRKIFGVRVLEGYGLSETAPVASFNHIEKPSKPGTVGQPLFAVEIRCVAENDEPVASGEPGEVVIRGHNVMKGYYKRPDATAEAMRNGWFHTGDIGTIDGDGYLSIVDRKKDMILRGGFNVYPRELEDVIITHPAVSLVAVVGVPDAKYGEEIKAFVVRKSGAHVSEDELIAWCKEQFAAYKYPRMIEFRESLPVSPTGKILRRELREAVEPA